MSDLQRTALRIAFDAESAKKFIPQKSDCTLYVLVSDVIESAHFLKSDEKSSASAKSVES